MPAATLFQSLPLDGCTIAFAILFLFRYVRVLVHLYAFWFMYKPAPIPEKPTYRPSDCTVILPTVEPDNADFKECIEAALENRPRCIIIANVGMENLATCKAVAREYMRQYPSTAIKCLINDEANKRGQVAKAIPYVETDIICCLDDHVFWPRTFLRAALAPFEDPKVGCVGTNKRVRRTETDLVKGFWNMLGCIYLERHNFEIRATNAIDGGVFVVSGRTALFRSSILKDTAFLAEFTNELFFFGKYGPLNADDDNCITRWLVNHGWKIKIQYSNEACIETTLGTYPKFISQCLRWVYSLQPWCVYAVYIYSFFNFALFYDVALISALQHSSFGSNTAMCLLVACIFAGKLIKLVPYFLRHPSDLWMLPGYFVFAWFHSFIKLYTGLTFYETTWGSRNLSAISDVAKQEIVDIEARDPDAMAIAAPESEAPKMIRAWTLKDAAEKFKQFRPVKPVDSSYSSRAHSPQRADSVVDGVD